jgi:hypothetical protein
MGAGDHRSWEVLLGSRQFSRAAQKKSRATASISQAAPALRRRRCEIESSGSRKLVRIQSLI